MKHYLKIIGIPALALIVGVGITWIAMRDRVPELPALLTTDYIEYCGFKEIEGGVLIYEFSKEIIPNTRDTITAYVAIVPDNKDNPKFYVIGMADMIQGKGYRFIRMGVITEQAEFDRWVTFISPEDEL